MFYVLFEDVLRHNYDTTLKFRVRRHCFTIILILVDITYSQFTLKLRNGITLLNLYLYSMTYSAYSVGIKNFIVTAEGRNAEGITSVQLLDI